MDNNIENIDTIQLPGLVENFSLLREKALAYIQQSSSQTWTDHNIHDPGITIMEALCYALADVGYRMNFPMQDLLTDECGNLPKHAFYYPKDILPCHAVTINDFRKILIDLPLVRNAWITPLLSPHDGIQVDYEPIYVYKKEGRLLLKQDLNDLSIPQAEKDEITNNSSLFIIGLYAITVEFETQPLLGRIDSGESFEGVYEKDFFGDIYYDIGNWHELMNNRFVLRQIADAYTLDTKAVTININNSPKNKYNNSDGQLDQRVLFEWYYTIEVLVNTNVVFTFTEVLFEPFLETGKGISGKNLKELLTKNNFSFFTSCFKKIQALAKAYASIYQVLNQHRNLCEEFLYQIAAIPTIEFRICADIDVDPRADIEQVQAEIYHKIEEYISPSIPFYSFTELKSKGNSIEDIIEGPSLQHGFILQSEMGEDAFQNFTIHLSDIINLISETSGLLNCRNVQMTLVDEDGILLENNNIWELPSPVGTRPVLNKRKSKFIYYKNELPLSANFKESIIKLSLLSLNDAKVNTSDIPLPDLKTSYRDLALHYSLADEFPATYKIGRHFPDSFLDRKDLFPSKQLEGYLLLFDQMIANFLTDIQHLKSTLSWDTTSHILHTSEHNEWRRPYLLSKKVDVDWQVIVESQDQFLEKRNESLDFLLSRFAEDLKDLDNFFYFSKDNIHIDQTEYFTYLIDLKQNFLANYISISSNRGAAVNLYDQAAYLESSICGYEDRISKLIGCTLTKNGKRKTVVDIDIQDNKERGYFHLLEHLLLRVPNLSNEMIIQLKSNGLTPELLSICADDDCTACGGYDPYSFTASIVLPAWLPVYADVHYRDFIERVIRRETPAGVLLRICWIDEASMHAYEEIIQAWWAAKNDLYRADIQNYNTRLLTYLDCHQQFVTVLKNLRSEYFKATLHGCDDEGEENNTRIFLDSTFLGKP